MPKLPILKVLFKTNLIAYKHKTIYLMVNYKFFGASKVQI